MDQPQVEVSDIVVGSITQATATTKKLFGLEKTQEILPFLKVVLAIRSLNGEAHAEVVEPIVNGILTDLGLDPANNAIDRVDAAEYAELIAMGIADATQMIYQQMQMMHQQAQQQRAAGAGQKLLGA